MNESPTRSARSDREELARLVPGSVERELPSDRHRLLQEFVMSEIHRDLHGNGHPPRRALQRRPVLLASALAAVAAMVAVGAFAAVGGRHDGTESPRDGAAPPPVALSGQEILLAAATTAQRQPAGTGTYWHVTMASFDAQKRPSFQLEEWVDRTGRQWIRSAKFGDRAVSMPDPVRYTLGGHVTLQQIQDLPTDPTALKAWIVTATETGDVRNSGGALTPDEKEKHVFYGLISLVSQLPAPPAVRAAALQAIAAYPNVVNLGPVEGGTGLRVPVREKVDARLVIDPATARIKHTNFFVTPDGALYTAGEGGSITLSAEWTDTPPV